VFWPSAQDYNEAVQNPSSVFADQDLRAAEIEVNRLGLPKVMSGAFASVYKMTANGASWAVRCFLNCRQDQRERYKAISDFILFDDLDCTVPFYYLEQGVKIKGAWYPILKMEWVEGITLEKFLDDNYKNSAAILDLLKQFDDMVLDLARAGIAHGDLQHGNIIVTKQGLRLVDYDALYVPALAGWESPEVGHPNFQHPQRSASHYDTAVDNFSAWLIHFSLLAISIDPELYRLVEGGDDCILFKRGDLKTPRQSELFKMLMQHPSTDLRQAALLIAGMLTVSPPSVPAFSASVAELSTLPDVSRMFLTELSEGTESGGEPVTPALGSTESLLPNHLKLRASGAGEEVIIRESYLTPSLHYARNIDVKVKLALFNRDLAGKVQSISDRTFLRYRPAAWCQKRLAHAKHLFESGEYSEASRVYLELSEVLEFLAIAQTTGSRITLFAKAVVVFLLIYWFIWFLLYLESHGLVTVSYGLLWTSLVIYCLVNSSTESPDFKPQAMLVATQSSIGFCFSKNRQWRVASNYFMMAVRSCKWGMEPFLRYQALLRYAICRNEGGDRKESIRFLMQKQEVLERLPMLVEHELRASELANSANSFQLICEIGKHYFDRKLFSSTLSPLLAARTIYTSLNNEDADRLRPQARDVLLSLAYVYTLRGDWSSAQESFNEAIQLCSKAGSAEDLREAQFCAALASSLKGDLTGATALISRMKFASGELTKMLMNADSVAHKILFYDKARGVSFILDMAKKQREWKRTEQVREFCCALMSVHRSSLTVTSPLALSLLDEMGDDFIAQVFQVSYFSGRELSASELTVLINSLLDASQTRTVLVLCEMLARENRIDSIDYLFNRLAANSELSKLVLNESASVQVKTDRLFVDVVLRICEPEFVEKLPVKPVPKDVVNEILLRRSAVMESVSGVIYGVGDEPPIVKSACLALRGVLRFVEFCLARQLAVLRLTADALSLYDKLEGYYSTNIDRLLDEVVTRATAARKCDGEWLSKILVTSQLAFQYRGESNNHFLTSLNVHVVDVTRRELEAGRASGVTDAILNTAGFKKGGSGALDTICATVLESSDKTSCGAEVIDLVIALAWAFVRSGEAERAAAMLSEVRGWSLPVQEMNSVTVAQAMIGKLELEHSAAKRLVEVSDSRSVLRRLMQNEVARRLACAADTRAIELLIETGDLIRLEDVARARLHYIAAAHFFEMLAPELANQFLAAKVTERLGDSIDSETVRQELAAFDADGSAQAGTTGGECREERG